MITIQTYPLINITELAGFKGIDRHNDMIELCELIQNDKSLLDDKLISDEVNFYLQEVNEFLQKKYNSEKLSRNTIPSKLNSKTVTEFEFDEVSKVIYGQRTNQNSYSVRDIMSMYKLTMWQFYDILKKLRKIFPEVRDWKQVNKGGRPKSSN